MKYFISTYILIALHAQASKIIIHYHESAVSNSKQVQSIFSRKYNIPNQLVQRRIGGCKVKEFDKRFLHLCINKKGELKTLSSDIHFKIKSLLAFRSLKEQSNDF